MSADGVFRRSVIYGVTQIYTDKIKYDEISKKKMSTDYILSADGVFRRSVIYGVTLIYTDKIK